MPSDKNGITTKASGKVASDDKPSDSSQPPASATDKSKVAVVSEVEEETHLYQPKHVVSKLRTSQSPNSQRTSPSRPGPIRIPTAPRIPADIAAAARSSRAPESPKVEPKDELDQTRGYTAGLIDELLRADEDGTSDVATSAADGDTRHARVPIEELASLLGRQANQVVGHDDPTKAYSLSSSAPDEDDTARANRANLRKFLHEAPVIVKEEPPRSRHRLIPLLGVGVAIAAVALAYGFARGRSSFSWQSSADLENPALSASAITVSISASPADATIILDGMQVTNPFLAQRVRDKSIHELMVDAPGYLPVRRKVQFERDITVVMALAPLAPAAMASESGDGTAAIDSRPGDGASAVASRPSVTAEPKARVSKPPSPSRVPVSSKAAAVTPKGATPEGKSSETNCNPPFTVDALNIKTFKPECL